MDRMACVNLRALPLQILLARNPDWRERPAALVSEDRPAGRVVMANRAARSLGIHAGMRYASALSLEGGLQAGTVLPRELEQTRDRIRRLLAHWSPAVEASGFDPGVFWVNASGLSYLYPSLSAWAEGMQEEIAAEGLRAAVGIGFSRFGTYAGTRTGRELLIMDSPEQELRESRCAPRSILPLSAAVHQRLDRLGIQRAEQLLALPEGGIRKRFGAETEEVYRFVASMTALPVQNREHTEDPVFHMQLPGPEESVERLMLPVRRLLDRLVQRCLRRGERIRGVLLDLRMEDGESLRQEVRPAEPTIRPMLLARLIHLRLESDPPPLGVEEISITGNLLRDGRETGELFPRHSGRPAEQAARAFAYLRAELGNEAVQRASLHGSHLPSERFRLEAMDRVESLQARARDGGSVLVRRVNSSGQAPPFFHRPVHLRLGPHLIEQRWWQEPVQRRYVVAQERDGSLLWLYSQNGEDSWWVQALID